MSRSARQRGYAPATSPRRLRVTEVFESLQGEGPFCCRRALFIRLAGCNLRCPFCDTPYSLDPRSGEPAPLEELVERAARHRGLVVLTGGEPLLQRGAVNRFLEQLWARDSGVEVQVETNGTLPPPEPGEPLRRAYFVVSPKDFPIAVPGARTHPGWAGYAASTGRAWFKLLAASEEHVAAAAAWAREKNLPPGRVYVMPVTSGDMSASELLEAHRRVARWALRYGLEFSPRMHLLLGLA